jgi:Protein of unknown function (DUF2510).
VNDEPRGPGWYPDPWSATEGEKRYFDGTAWVRNESVAPSVGTLPRRRRSTWWLGAVVLVVAVAVAFVVGGRSSPDTGSPSARRVIADGLISTSTTKPHIDLESRSYRQGDCVVWKQVVGEPRAVKTVSCGGAHLLEMIDRVELKNMTGPYPTEAAWNLIFEEQCSPLVASYLDAPIDPYGRYAVSGLEVGQDGWDLGDRTIWCGVAAQGVSPIGPDALVLFSERAHGSDQTKLQGVGTCLGPVAGGSQDVVDCAGPHEIEVTGSVDLNGRIDHAPNLAEMDGLALDACNRIASDYLGHSLGGGVAAAPFGLEPASWEAGRRVVECVVGHSSGTDWVSSTGSMKAGA